MSVPVPVVETDATAFMSELSLGSPARAGFFSADPVFAVSNAAEEAVVAIYRGDHRAIDIAFWNIEWFNRDIERKLYAVSRFIADANIDVWALEEVSPQSTAALVAHLEDTHGLTYGYGASQPSASPNLQTTTVIWNKATVDGRRVVWPDEVETFFRRHSRDPLDDLQNFEETVEGKIFDRYPGLFHLTVRGVGMTFYVVPLHLKAMPDGSKRRRIAARILSAAVNYCMKQGLGDDWILGGDLNATLASEDFKPLETGGFVAVSAQDERAGAFTYVKRPHQSLIDHVYLSPNLTARYGPDDFFIIAADRSVPHYTRDLSDHRPVLLRLTLPVGSARGGEESVVSETLELPEWAREAVADL